MPNGYFSFVLHAHMPYVRQAGRGAHGEEMLHEAIVESYLPLLNVCYDLRAEALPCPLTLAIPPILAEQLADTDILDRFETFLLEKIGRAEADVQRFQATAEEDPQADHCLYLARFYVDWYSNLLQSFRERFERDLIAALRRLQNEDLVEIVTAPVTQAYLPLLERDSSIYAQLKTGVTSHLRHFGRLPRGLWLPEHGYRPANITSEGDRAVKRPGLEEFLADLNLGYIVTETQSIVRDSRKGRDTDYPYYIQGSNVAVYGRDTRVGKQVWSASEGYPGDYVYREFQRRDERSGFQYWRVTGDRLDLEQKELYDPYNAFRRAQQHAAHFVEMIREQLREYGEHGGRPGIIVAAYAAELLGRWWFEGLPWLKHVLLLLAQDPQVTLTMAGDYLKLYPPQQAIALTESSWGEDQGQSCWLNPKTEWMWPLIHEAERRMERLVARFPDARGDRLEVLKQIARELLLLQCSDWPFLEGEQQVVDYATQRFQEQLARFNRLVLLVEKESLDDDERLFLQECQHLDNPFLNMDYRVFAARGEQVERE